MLGYLLYMCKVQVKVHQETKENLMIDLDHLAQSPVPVVLPSPGLLPLTPQKMPDFQRRLLRRHDLPSNWMIKRGKKYNFLNIFVELQS